jgi:cysteine desulfurase
MSYFDWNATAPLHPVAREAWLDASERFWANASTSYRLGAQAHLALEEARESVAGCLGVNPDQVVFTSGATEANNAIIRELAGRSPAGGRILISAVEHPSVVAAAQHFWGSGRVERVPVNGEGRIDLDWLAERLRKDRPELLSVMAVNNETGVIQPVAGILELCQSTGVPFHCDAVQWIGKEPLQPAGLDWGSCAGVTLSAHKFGGPKGVGCLLLGREMHGLKVQAGGAQEHGSRAGTENVPAILAMVAALEHRRANPVRDAARKAHDAFESGLESLWGAEIHIHGMGAPRIWNTTLVALPAHRSSRWISRLDRHGFQVSSGSACSAGKEGPSPVLKAMGVDAETAGRTLRISGGWETQAGEWTALLEALGQVREELDAATAPEGPGTVIEIE